MLIAFLLAQSATAEGWKDLVCAFISSGEFSRAEQIIDQLSEEQKYLDKVAIDSLKGIMLRVRKDFSITPAQGRLVLKDVMGREVSDAEIRDWKDKKYIETMTIDDQEWWFRKVQRNFRLLNWELFTDEHVALEKAIAEDYQTWIDEAMKSAPDKNHTRNWQRATVKMTLDVYADAVPAGETLRVWLPIPFENLRQRNIRMGKTSHDVVPSKGSKHHTVYLEAQAEAGQPTHFEINYTFETGERHIDQAELLERVKPYDKTSDVYRENTRQELPHMIVNDQLKFLANKIVRSEKNPVLQAAMIFDYITANFPWAGAREYSTIENIPMYVLRERHGDCGQVTLLYISLCRSIGIPARWESGWVIEPGSEGFHDWAETYFEGIGWVNTDVSYGTAGFTKDGPAAYYKSGIDWYRLATNEGIADVLSPVKKYARSESVDFQAGEVEWRGGNLENSDWESSLSVQMTPLR